MLTSSRTAAAASPGHPAIYTEPEPAPIKWTTTFINQRRAQEAGAQQNLALGAALGVVALLALLVLVYLLRRLDYLRNPIRIHDTGHGIPSDIEFNDQPAPRRQRGLLRRPGSQSRSTSLVQLIFPRPRERLDSQRSASSANSTSRSFDAKSSRGATAGSYRSEATDETEPPRRHPYAEATPVVVDPSLGLANYPESSVQLMQIAPTRVSPDSSSGGSPPKTPSKAQRIFSFPASPTSPITQDITSPRTPKWSITTSATTDSAHRTALQPPRPRSNPRPPRTARHSSTQAPLSIVSNSSNSSNTRASILASPSAPANHFGHLSGGFSPPFLDDRRSSAGSRRPPSVSAVEGGNYIRASLQDRQPRSPSLPEGDEPNQIGAAY